MGKINNFKSFLRESYSDLDFTTSVLKVTEDTIHFDNGVKLTYYHETDYCEMHYLDFTHITLDDFDGMQFDLSSDDFLEKIPGYGIALKPLNGYPVRIPGYAANNGYYSSNLSLILSDSEDKAIKSFDITECQEWGDY